MAESWWTETEAEEWSDALVASMKLGGVDNLFFVSGTELNFYQEAIAKARAKGRPAPNLVTMTLESTALNAAIGNSMVRDAPSATAVHVDAGTLHMGAAIHTAWRSGAPILMTAGTAPRALPGSMRGARSGGVSYLQEPRDQGEIVRQYTKADHKLDHIDHPGLAISRLLQIAMSEPRGPVYLAIPQETAMLPLPGTTSFPTAGQLGLARQAWPDPDDATLIAKWLVDADNPVMFTGGAGRDPQAVEAMVRLAELLAIPVSVGMSSDRMNFPATHWAYGTGPDANAADVILVMEDVTPFTPGPRGPSGDAKIAWTSLDPVYSRYLSRDFRSDLWLPASVAAVAKAVYDAATPMLTTSRMSKIEERRERLQQRRQELDARLESLATDDIKRGVLNGRVVGYELAKHIDASSIILNDGLSNGGFVQAYARRSLPGTYFRSGSTSGGWGSGASFGVKLARPDADVIHATGDGYFMFGAPPASLWAASHHKAPYLTIVYVNGTYSTGTSMLRDTYPEGFGVHAGFDGGVFDPAPDFAKLAESINGYGEDVTELDALGPAMTRAFKQIRNGTPALLAVHVPGPLSGEGAGGGNG